jgi:hypothetical protein
MSSPELNVECPCCKARLVVDAASGIVLQATEHRQAPQSLENFLKSEAGRAKELEDKFEEARRIEKNKDKLPDVPRPGIQWD